MNGIDQYSKEIEYNLYEEIFWNSLTEDVNLHMIEIEFDLTPKYDAWVKKYFNKRYSPVIAAQIADRAYRIKHMK